MGQFKQYLPSYIDGDREVHEIDYLQAAYEIPYVKHFRDLPNFYRWAKDGDYLIALLDWNDEFNGCTKWCVVGTFVDIDISILKDYTTLTASHKPTCWKRKFKANEDLLSVNAKPIETQKKVAKELGWTKDDLSGIFMYCDCGYKEVGYDRRT